MPLISATMRKHFVCRIKSYHYEKSKSKRYKIKKRKGQR
jgi:hypothetical protein